MTSPDLLALVLSDIAVERDRIQKRHNQSWRPDASTNTHGHPIAHICIDTATIRAFVDELHEYDDDRLGFDLLLLETVAETIASLGTDEMRRNLVQVAAVAVQWLEAMDLRPT